MYKCWCLTQVMAASPGKYSLRDKTYCSGRYSIACWGCSHRLCMALLRSSCYLPSHLPRSLSLVKLRTLSRNYSGFGSFTPKIITRCITKSSHWNSCLSTESSPNCKRSDKSSYFLSSTVCTHCHACQWKSSRFLPETFKSPQGPNAQSVSQFLPTQD